MSDKVVSFDMNAARATTGPALRADVASEVVLPKSGATQATVDVAVVFAALTGTPLAARDLHDRLSLLAGEGTIHPDHVATALDACGLACRLQTIATPDKDAWPALAQMTYGQLVLILSQNEDHVVVYDPATSDKRSEVALDVFRSVYAGKLISPVLSTHVLQNRHADAKPPQHWFWDEFQHHKRAFIEVAAGSAVANLLAVSVALFSLQVYDRVIPHQSEPTLWVLAIGALLAIGLEAMLKWARSTLMDVTGRRIELSVQDRLMQRLLHMRAAPGERKPSQLFSAMRDFGSVREFFSASTIGAMSDLPFIFIFLALVASIGGNLVWVLVAGGILMVLPGFLLQNRIVALTQATQGASVRAGRVLYEAIYEHETLTTSRGEDRVARIWSELAVLTSAKTGEQRELTALLGYWAQAAQQVTYVVAVMVGTYLVFAGQFTVGTIIAIGILTSRTLAPLAGLSATMARWSNTKAALIALDAVAEAPQAEEPGRAYLRRDRLIGAYEISGLDFRYDAKAAPTLDIAALAIPAGQRVAVLGTNGSGKSTLLRVLAGLYEPNAGRVLIDGVDMAQVHPRDLRRSIGYLGQDVRLFAGTIRDNLNLTQLERDDDRLLAALDFAGLGPFVRSHPRGLDLEIKEMGEGLSVGQRQSVGWARLWLQDPVVAILDEPTAALDQTLEATMVSRLHAWLEGRTAIIATHRVPILQLTTRTLILQNGRMAVDGPRDAVLAHLSKAQGAAK
jgi:ATP-binding cassette, subfamily C, bacterial LapB